MEILKFPHPTLLEPCNEVTVFGKEVEILLDAMWETLRGTNGMGLAANQVGIRFRMFVMQGPRGPLDHKYFINPSIKWKSVAPANKREGCLSAPGDFVLISERSNTVLVEYQDASGEKKSEMFSDIWAVCVQHEIEHLDGKAFIQSGSIPKAKRRDLLKKWKI